MCRRISIEINKRGIGHADRRGKLKTCSLAHSSRRVRVRGRLLLAQGGNLADCAFRQTRSRPRSTARSTPTNRPGCSIPSSPTRWWSSIRRKIRAGPRDELGSIARRQDLDLQAARRRDVPGRNEVRRRGGEVQPRAHRRPEDRFGPAQERHRAVHEGRGPRSAHGPHHLRYALGDASRRHPAHARSGRRRRRRSSASRNSSATSSAPARSSLPNGSRTTASSSRAGTDMAAGTRFRRRKARSPSTP